MCEFEGDLPGTGGVGTVEDAEMTSCPHCLGNCDLHTPESFISRDVHGNEAVWTTEGCYRRWLYFRSASRKPARSKAIRREINPRHDFKLPTYLGFFTEDGYVDEAYDRKVYRRLHMLKLGYFPHIERQVS